MEWILTEEQIKESLPSRSDGITYKDEKRMRRECAAFIQQFGEILELLILFIHIFISKILQTENLPHTFKDHRSSLPLPYVYFIVISQNIVSTMKIDMYKIFMIFLLKIIHERNNNNVNIQYFTIKMIIVSECYMFVYIIKVERRRNEEVR